VFEVLGLETNRDEFILFLKTRLVGSKDQVFPGMDIGYFELGISTMGPKAIWILSQLGITFAEQSHDMTPTENFVRTSRAPRFSYLHSSTHAKKGTAEYMAVRPFTDEAVRYHQLTARPQPSGRQQEVFNFAGYRDFNNELLQRKSSRSSQPAPKGFFGSASATSAPFRSRDPRSCSSLDPENVEYLYEKSANQGNNGFRNTEHPLRGSSASRGPFMRDSFPSSTSSRDHAEQRGDVAHDCAFHNATHLKDHRKEEPRQSEGLFRHSMGEHDGDASSNEGDSSEDDDSLSDRKKVPKERFARIVSTVSH
jgi:hypothetical protein